MKKYFVFLLVILLGSFSCGQLVKGSSHNEKLVIRILNCVVDVRPEDKFLTLDVSVENKGDSSFILYNFHLIYPRLMPLSDHMDLNTTAENLLIGYNKKGDLKILTAPRLESDPSLISDSASYIEDTIKKEAIRYDINKLLIEKRSTWTGKLYANLDQVLLSNQDYIEELEKIKIDGEFEALLVYRCGKYIFNVLPQKKVKEDEDRYNAKLFQGYIKSNTIRIVVHDK